MDVLQNNYQWIFGGVGVFVLGIIWNFLISRKHSLQQFDNKILIDKDLNRDKNLEALKPVTKILFIDDDTKFKVVQILKRSGWIQTKIIKDVRSLDCSDITEANILFVDIQGVGKYLEFSDEGLGLAYAIKQKFPQKKVVIYSAETKGDRFHKALRYVDSFLSKNADPYEFQQIVEEMVG